MAQIFTIRNQSNTKSVDLMSATLTGIHGLRGGLGPTRIPQEVLVGGKLAESYQLVVFENDHDGTAALVQNLYDLLMQATQFGDEGWQGDAVYIVQKGRSETNERYSRVVTWLDYEYPNLFGNPFSQSSVLDPLVISIVRTHPWTSQPVGTLGDAIQLVESDGPAAPDMVHVANFRDDGNLTFVKVDNGGAFTDIIDAGTGTDLFPAAPVLDDALYLGANDDTPAKHYCIGVSKAMVGFNGAFSLEYWDGADWLTATTLGVDYTIFSDTLGEITELDDLFTATGLWSINVLPFSDWANTTIDGEDIRWLRIRISTFVAMATVPEKDGSDIYAQRSHFVEIPAASIVGDSHPIANIRLWTPSGGDENTTFANLSRALIGVKSEHGNVDLDDFEPFLNAGDVDNPGACSVAYGDDTSSVADNEAPGGFHAYCDFGNANMVKRVTFTLDDLLPSYDGEYRLLIGVQQIGGDAGDINTKGRLFVGGATDTDPHADTRERVTRGESNGCEALDLGLVGFPLSRAYYSDVLTATDVVVEIHAERLTGAAVLRIYFSYLFPIGEGSIGIDDPVTDTTKGSSALRGGNVMDIDAGMIADRNQKYIIESGELIPAQEWRRFNRPIEFKNLATKTRLYFLMLHFAEGNDWNTEPMIATFGCHLACEIFMSYQFATLRGAI